MKLHGMHMLELWQPTFQVESYNMFLKDIRSHGSTLVVKRYMGCVDEDLVVQLTEANEADCSFGLALG